MKKWLIALALSSFLSILGLSYFIYFIVQDKCLDGGGRWLGVWEGCDGSSHYSIDHLLSPLSVAIFLGIILGIASFFIQCHKLIFRAV